MAFLSLHGFGSSPQSNKNVALAAAFEARGLTLHRPDLNQPSFAKLSFAAMLAQLDRVDREVRPERWCIVGSSLGGYVAGLWAAAHPERVRKMVLLCPAFELAQRWSTLVTPDELSRWEREGAMPFRNAQGDDVGLHFRFVEEARTITPMPQPSCPIRVIHGLRDERVPIELSRRFVATDPSRRSLLELDDGHELRGDLDLLCREVLGFFEVTHEA